ncbi:hypothetical protein M0R45_031192 [Rubus argutus]|uniref:DUF7787 domain-containing protein n=1 Tax=Rubus argutus TaxID=59490 RepID=A0AAW1WCW8_RUBAR
MEKMSKAKNQKISLEDYLLLIQSRSHLNLTVSHLNQIITMHGYKKIHKVHKKLLSDAVNTLDLVNPCRSTLRDYISPLVTTKVEDVMADLSDLNWQECCVTSIQTLSSWNGNTDDQSPPANDNPSSVVCASSRKSTRKRKRTAKMADLVNFA